MPFLRKGWKLNTIIFLFVNKIKFIRIKVHILNQQLWRLIFYQLSQSTTETSNELKGAYILLIVLNLKITQLNTTGLNSKKNRHRLCTGFLNTVLSCYTHNMWQSNIKYEAGSPMLVRKHAEKTFYRNRWVQTLNELCCCPHTNFRLIVWNH